MLVPHSVSLITGGASGLGAAVARHLGLAGGRVLIADRNQDSGSALAAELGPGAAFQATDVADAGAAEAAVRRTVDTFGKLDILVNCAGIAAARRVLGKEGPMPLEEFHRVIEVNLVGTFNVIRVAAEAMSRNPPSETGERGVIVNTASVAAFDGQIGQAAYSASKGGIAGMTLPLAREFARVGIRVMTIAPGMFRTPLLAGLPSEAMQALEKHVPFPPRLGEPSEYAMLVQHIVENSYLNGEVIRLDGALRMPPK